MNPLFPQLPEDLSVLSDAELAEALAAHLSAVERIRSNDQEFLGDRDADAIIGELRSGVEQVRALRAEQSSRAEAAAEFERQVAELTDEVKPEDEEEDTDEDAAEEEEPKDEAQAEETPEAEAEPAAAELLEEEAEPLLAAPTRILRRPPAPSRERTPAPEGNGLQVRASHGIDGITPGALLDRRGLGEALAAAHRATTAVQPGVRQYVTVASVEYPFPEDRQLSDRDPEGNANKFKALLDKPADDLQALIAMGGFCAPFTPFYESIVYATAARPVRDGLPSYQPARGGITYPPAMSLSDARDAITIWTAETDADPGTNVKACLVIDCPEFLEAEIEAIVACVQHQNFTAMTWPERISELAELVAAAHAEAGEVELLDGLKAGSTQLTGAAVYGAVSTLLTHILEVAAGIRNRERMTRDRPMHVVLPMWTSDLLVNDLVNSQFDRFARTQGGVTALLQQYGINVSWYMDSATGDGQMFATQGAGALEPYPDTVKWFIYPEGTWIFLDRGRLDLGIIRDSTLNATNTFQVFYETFEGIAKIGPTSYEVTSTVCPSGLTGGTANSTTPYACA